MRGVRPAACVVLAALAAGLALARPPAGRKFALLVGVGEYQTAFADLARPPVNDVTELAKVLKADGYRGNVLTNKQATRAAVEAAFRRLLDGQLADADPVRPLGPDDTLVVHLCGHGVQVERVGDDGRPAAEPYFCPTDAVPGRPGTMIGLNDLITAAAGRGVRAMFLVDACRENTDQRLRGGAGIAGAWARMPANVSVLFSCKGGQFAQQDAQLGHGLFTYAILRAARGQTGLNRVSWSDLVAAVEDQFGDPKGVVGKRLAGPQTPVKAEGESGRTLLLASVPKADGRAMAREDAVERAELFRSAGQQRTRRVRAVDLGGGQKLTVARLPAGTFLMGADEPADVVQQAFDEADNPDLRSEHPRHRVTLGKPFDVGLTEVTVAQYAAFVAASGYVTDVEKAGGVRTGHFNPQAAVRYDEQAGQRQKASWRDRGTVEPAADRLPVVLVSWRDAVAFCDWVTVREGRKCRLPTEAEWEYASRGGTQTRYWFGADPEYLLGRANVPDATFLADYQTRFNRALGYRTIAGADGFVSRSPAGAFEPNPFGLHDTHGNVWEWCGDWYDPDYYAASPGTDPRGPLASPQRQRVMRGGCHT